MNLNRIVNRQLLLLKKNSPHILFGVGVAGGVASTVMACRATLKLTETLEKTEFDMKCLAKVKTYVDNPSRPEYTAQSYAKDSTILYTRAGMRLVKLYGPAAAVGAVSIACLAGSHVQLTQRNAALMAAYAMLDRAYREYRDRVRDEVGAEKEEDLYRSVHTEVIKNEMGNKEVVRSFDPNNWSAYAKMFDESSKHWEKDPELNRLFIQCQQNYANNLLHSRGHIFLNEVYDLLDIPRTKAGQVVGWCMDCEGDGFIDFGMFEGINSRANMFINGQERSIILDFNVDGVIYDRIDKIGDKS